jgi:hypothetical protein
LGLSDFIFTLDSYDIIERAVPDRTQTIAYLNSVQSAEGTWATGQNHYVPITAQILMFLKRSGVQPEKSLDIFFSTVDTWEKVNIHVQTYVPQNYWGGLWGFLSCYVVYKCESPPWAQDFLYEADEKFDTWAYSAHQRTHLILNFIQLQYLFRELMRL